MESKVSLCSTCRTPIPREEALRPPTFPFCSSRCKMVDLGKWLGGEYVIPEPIRPDDYEAIEAVIAAQTGEG